jgi:uncharacterized protein (DUF885 family)
MAQNYRSNKQAVERRLFLFLFCLSALGCASAARLDSIRSSGGETAESLKLDQIFDRYFEEDLQLFPTFATSIGDHRYDDQLSIAISDEHREKQRALYLRSLVELAGVKADTLGQQDRLNYDVFQQLLAQRLEALNFDQHLMPLRQLNSLAVEFPLMGSGKGIHPFKTPWDYDNFLKRMEQFREWVDAAIENVRRGAARGVVQPRVVMERVLPQLDAMVVVDPDRSLFFQPILQIPDHFTAIEKIRLSKAYTGAITEQIIPAYQKLSEFIRREYLPQTRASVALTDLPQGSAWYGHLVKSQTTTDLTPDEIFQLGLNEIDRINKERDGMRAASNFRGSLLEFAAHLEKNAPPGFQTKQDLVAAYEEIRNRVTPKLSNLFGRLSKAPYEIRTVEEFRERSAPSQYRSPSPDGSRPGIFYVNASGIEVSPRRPSESLFIHEAVPGHHFQISLQREQASLPRFRRFGGYTALVEGWALYAESLGPELGLYTEPHQYFTRLNSQLFRAARLVVDVGLHRKGWGREQALRFMMENTFTVEAAATLEIDRYIAVPGQALAYKIGQLKISAIRAKAEAALGANFDIRDFHDELLKDGAMPLDLLEAKMDRWIEAQRRSRN